MGLGPCAKKTVFCTIMAPDGVVVGVGSNHVRRPQDVCPRLPGEGYEKCSSVCDQPGHAEIVALRMAGEEAAGAVAYIEGIDKICGDCLRQMAAAGIARVIMGAPR